MNRRRIVELLRQISNAVDCGDQWQKKYRMRSDPGPMREVAGALRLLANLIEPDPPEPGKLAQLHQPAVPR